MQLSGRAVGDRQGFVWIQNGLARTADWSVDPARPRRYPINRSEKSVPDPNQAHPVSLCSIPESKRPSAVVPTFRKDPWESVKSVSHCDGCDVLAYLASLRLFPTMPGQAVLGYATRPSALRGTGWSRPGTILGFAASPSDAMARPMVALTAAARAITTPAPPSR